VKSFAKSLSEEEAASEIDPEEVFGLLPVFR
jgi:hypothetical protein